MKLLAALLAALALSATAAAATSEPQFQPSQADQAWTDAIVISAGDVGGGWQRDGLPGAITGETSPSPACSLPAVSDLVLTGGTYSPDFYRSDGAYVAATAVTWQTPEQAQADWSRTLQPAVMGCLAADLQAESTKKVKVVITGRHQLSWPTVGERSVVYRISLVLKARSKVKKKWHTVSARATADLLAVGVGRARALIWTFAFDAHPLSDATQQEWAGLMAQRMASPPAPA
jgi:hypothetical protein